MGQKQTRIRQGLDRRTKEEIEKWDQTESPEIPDWGWGTSETPGLPSGREEEIQHLSESPITCFSGSSEDGVGEVGGGGAMSQHLTAGMTKPGRLTTNLTKVCHKIIL